MVAPSLTGRSGSETADAGWQLLDSGRADLLASDAHRADHGRRRLTRALELVSARLGHDAIVELTETNPRRLLGPALQPT